MSTEDIESRIKHLSLHESSGVPLKKGMSSQYRNNFQPFEVGMRTFMWKEGYDQRCHRKKNGFNHFKLEWIVPTDRSIGRSKYKAQESERRLAVKVPCYGKSRSEPVTPNFEPLRLPPSHLDLKRDRLAHIYEKKERQERQRMVEKNKKTSQLTSAPDVETKAKALIDGKAKTMSSPSNVKHWVAMQYEKNKKNNLQSNIQLFSESVVSSTRSSAKHNDSDDSPAVRSASAKKSPSPKPVH